jgi:hypothetical protein
LRITRCRACAGPGEQPPAVAAGAQLVVPDHDVVAGARTQRRVACASSSLLHAGIEVRHGEVRAPTGVATTRAIAHDRLAVLEHPGGAR